MAMFVCLKLPHTYVRPVEWKRFVGIPVGAGKNASVIRANQLFPHLKLKPSEDGRADAALIAYYGLRKLTGKP